MFIGRTNVEAETPTLWPPDVKSWLIWKDPDTGKDWGQAEKGMTEDEMVGWHHWLDGHGFGWTLGVLEGLREAWRAAVHGVTKSQTQLSDWTELNVNNNQTSLTLQKYVIPDLFLNTWEKVKMLVAQSCPTLCDPMDCSTPGFPVLLYLPEFAQTHVHWVGDAIQPSHSLLPPSPPALNLSQYQGLFQWAGIR